MLGLFGAALLYGDGMITPAISVLSAVEGLEVATHTFQPYVVPITVGILIALFLVQKRGTGGIGTIFGPMMLRLVRCRSRRSACRRSCGTPRCCARPARRTRSRSSRTTARRASSCSARSCSSSPAARRSTPTWATSASGRSASPGTRVVFPALVLQLLRAGRAPARATASTRVGNPFYALAHGWTLYPMVVARDGGDGDRVAGADLGRVLAHAAGGAARLLAARAHRPHVGARRPGRSTSPRSTATLDGRRASRSCSASASRTTSRRRTASR